MIVRKKCLFYMLLKVAIAFLSLTTVTPANATALYQTSLQVTLSVSDSSGGSLQIFSIIDDDGTDPSTTYSFVDPPGSPGSSTSSLAGVAFSGSDPLNFSASTNGTTVGIDPSVNVSAFSTAITKGGFYLINDGINPIDAVFTVDWSWSSIIAADNNALDSSITLTNLTIWEDGALSDTLLSEFFQTPLDSDGSNSGQVHKTLTVDPSGTRLFSVGLETTGLAQSTGKAENIPEPGTLTLLLLSLLSIPFLLRSKS